MKRILTFIFATIIAGQVWAEDYDFVYNGLCYNQVNGKKYTAEVTQPGTGKHYQATTITIPEKAVWFLGLMDGSVEFSVVGIGSSAFWGCSNLNSISIPNSINYIDKDAFSGCSSLDSITIPNSVKTIGEWAFCNCKSLTSITIPNSVTEIGDEAFLGCSNLTSIIIESDIDVRYAQLYFTKDSIRYQVRNNGIVEVASRVWNSNQTLVDGATYYSGRIIIPSTIIAGDTFSVNGISNGAFRDCINLESVIIPNSATSIGPYAFEGCTNLKEVIIPESVTSIDWDAFKGCNNLQYYEYDNALYLGNDDNPYLWLIKAKSKDISSCEINGNCKYIATDAFIGCKSLKTVLIPNSVIKIGNLAFYGCSNLESVSIPNSVTEIGNRAFISCNNLSVVTIPESVTKIDYSAFYGCSNLTIYCEASSQPKGWNKRWNEDNLPVVWGYNPTSIAESAANAINIYAHRNTIVVENATDEIRVYDAMGALVCSDAIHRIRAEITVNGTGVYIVKTGSIVKRVMVND